MAIGASYFGNRILRHVRADMEDLAARGFTGVLHTMSENDYHWYREQMGRIVAASHDVGLEVQVGPWGVGHAFGGEAESLFAAKHPDLGQVFDNGRRVGAVCLNQPRFRTYLKDWADAALEAGADRVFWDEPHWAHPRRFDLDLQHWSCRCELCRRLFFDEYGVEMPVELTEEVADFRERSLVGFVRDLVAHVADRGGHSTVCLLPLVEGTLGLRDWEPVAAADGLHTLATDPYWAFFGEPAREFSGRFARRVRELGDAHGLVPQIWIQGFMLGPEHVDEIHDAVRAARAEGVEDLWTWGYEACGHMTHLNTRQPEVVWEALTSALTGGGSG
jgi:pimeloyl-ACP methyl ester carboxylesterase